MNKYMILFRLADPNVVNQLGQTGSNPALTREQKYDKLIEYLNEKGSYLEDKTTSTILFQSISTLTKIVSDIKDFCQLSKKDMVLFIEFDRGEGYQDYRIQNGEITCHNEISNWIVS